MTRCGLSLELESDAVDGQRAGAALRAALASVRSGDRVKVATGSAVICDIEAATGGRMNEVG